jgi:hypothetical protein
MYEEDVQDKGLTIKILLRWCGDAVERNQSYLTVIGQMLPHVVITEEMPVYTALVSI